MILRVTGGHPLRSILLNAVAAFALLGGAGCATKPEAPPAVEAEGMANPEVALQRTVERVGRATADLYATRAGERPAVPAELRRPLTWRWSGPLDEAGRIVAAHIGYSFTAPGDGPALPVVRVAAKDAAALDVLKDIGAQVGAAATVAVDPQRRVVEVRQNGG